MDQCLCVGGAESFLAMNHCKIPNIYWKYWNCFENLEFLIPPVGRETWWVKNWRRQWWRRRERRRCHGCAVRSGLSSQQLPQGKGRGACHQPWLNWEPAGLCPRHLIAWFWGAFLCFFFLLCERRKRKQTARSLFKLAHSDTLGQILDTHARERPWLKAPEKNQMLPTQRKLT